MHSQFGFICLDHKSSNNQQETSRTFSLPTTEVDTAAGSYSESPSEKIPQLDGRANRVRIDLRHPDSVQQHLADRVLGEPCHHVNDRDDHHPDFGHGDIHQDNPINYLLEQTRMQG